MSVTRGMGAAVWIELRSQYQEASGTELLRDGNMMEVGTAAWISIVGAPLSKQPYLTGQVLRVGAVGAYGAARTAVAVMTVGRTYRARILVRGDGAGVATAEVRDGGGPLLGTATNSTVMQSIDATFVATTGSIDLAVVGASGYVEYWICSLQEVVTKTSDDGDYCSNETYLLSNRGGAQECASLVKFETVDRHTGTVETVADFSVSPGAPAVITPPTGWVYACASAARTTQTSVSTLVTGLGSNAAPWRDAGGGKGLAVEKAATNYVLSSYFASWSLSAACTRAAAVDPAGGMNASTLGDPNPADIEYAYLGGISCAGVGLPHVESCWIGNASASVGATAINASNNIAGNVSVTPPTVGWGRYSTPWGNATVAASVHSAIPAYALAGYTGQADFYASQFETGKYPSSVVLTAGVSVTRSAATLTVPLDVCNTLSGKIPRFTIAPHFAHNETLLDETICDDSRGHLFYEQTTQKFVYEVRGRGRIASLACTFSREQTLVVRGDMDEATGLMTLIVSGATTGNGTFQTYAAATKSVLVGNGFTAATFPTQLGPSLSVRRGNSFDGSDYLQPNTKMQPFGNNGTVFLPYRPTPAILAAASTHVLALLGFGSNYPDGFLLNQNGTGLLLYWGGAATALTLAAALTPATLSVALVNRAGTLEGYVDGRLLGTAAATASNVKSLPFAIMGDPAVLLPSGVGTANGSPFVSPLALTPQQIRILHQQLLANLST